MSWLRQIIFGLAATTVVCAAQSPNPSALPVKPISSALIPPPLPQTTSPVKFFRELLAMTPVERSQTLASRTPETRERIKAKVSEYLKLGANERELRLRATELRWYLTPLFRTAPADRTERIGQLPEDLRELVKSRLAQWDLLPPGLQKEFLDNDHALHYFAHVETTNAVATSAEQQKISEQFNQFFELTAEEKVQTLGTLSEAERAAMEKTLQSFEQLPAQQRNQCVRNYTKFAGMTSSERAEFLKNAEYWSQMSPQERQSWRDLVAHVPQWPPLPPTMTPRNLMPPTPPKISRAVMVTN